MATLDPAIKSLLKDSASLIPAIVQDFTSKQVLMLAYMNLESLALSIESGRATYWSRSRGEIWIKGATSGNFQKVHTIALDCDGDAILIEVTQIGVACHTGNETCFFTPIEIICQ